MPPGHSTSPGDPVRLHLTVTELPAVQRVLALLTGRRYALTRFAADEAGGGRWRVTLDLVADADQVELLGARLHRVPSVLAVDVAAAAALVPAG
jgi:acetolactate synthase regulatory subunit